MLYREREVSDNICQLQQLATQIYRIFSAKFAQKLSKNSRKLIKNAAFCIKKLAVLLSFQSSNITILQMQAKRKIV